MILTIIVKSFKVQVPNCLQFFEDEKLTKNSVDGISVSVDECGDDVHHAQDDQRQQQQCQDGLLGSGYQALDENRRNCITKLY